jgi:hypothetical protein
MLDKLAGRLTWEQTATGIRVEIPGWMGWRTLFFCAWLAFWTYGGWQALKSERAEHNSFLLLWLFFWAGGELFVGGAILWSLFGRTDLTLDPANLNLTYFIAGFQFRGHSFPTDDIRNLRYQPFSRSGRSQNLSSIRFESNKKTCSFASGISDAEAFALIDKMLEVYPFPKERALEYLDLSR